MEFGKNSPVGIMCIDKQISLEDLNVTPEQISLLERLFESRGNMLCTSHERKELLLLDQRLDIPLVEAYLDEEIMYDPFHRLVMNDCSIIPEKYKTNEYLVKQAVIRGDYQTFLKAHDMSEWQNVFLVQDAASYNRIDMIQYLWENNHFYKDDKIMVPYIAAMYGYIDLLTFCHTRIQPWDESIMRRAIASGRLSCVKYLFDHGCPWNERVFMEAAKNNHVDILEFFTAFQTLPREVGFIAARLGHLNVLEFLQKQNFPWCTEMMNEAAFYNRLECVIFLHEHGCEWNETTMNSAATRRHIDMFVYLCEQGCPMSISACYDAIKLGCVDAVKALVHRGCYMNEENCELAARRGYLDILQILHEHGCPWNKNTCESAAMYGHLDCLQYAKHHGCPLNKIDCVVAATYNKHMNIIRYIQQQQQQ
jgi:hypothetical protein